MSDAWLNSHKRKEYFRRPPSFRADYGDYSNESIGVSSYDTFSYAKFPNPPDDCDGGNRGDIKREAESRLSRNEEMPIARKDLIDRGRF